MDKSDSRNNIKMYLPFSLFFLFIIKIKIKEMYRKVVEKTEHGFEKRISGAFAGSLAW